ncbi:MAG: universal stress protein [Methanobacteriota archaeon]|nr:MAG: universal stress protein [Euryarchaeota archaeon]
MGKILVGYDGSEGARKAIDRAASMWKEGDEIVVVFVLPPTKIEEFAGFDTDLTEEKARGLLDEVAESLERMGIPVTTSLREGDVADEIIELGTELDCDLIVVGSYGLSKVGTFALGDVAEKVAKKSSRPVLLVR